MKKLSRREFLTTIEAIGLAAFVDGLVLNKLQANPTNLDLKRPTKVERLTTEPVLTIAHCCDPQLGFHDAPDSDKYYQIDLRRLRRELELVDELSPDLILFAGDMTNRYQDVAKDWPELLKNIRVPQLVAPGNHDIPDPLTAKGVVHFTNVFGKEYDSITIRGWKIIAFNSQYIRTTKEEALYDAQVRWFRTEIEDAKAKDLNVIVASHVPPFVESIEEKDEYFNFPSNLRRSFLDYLLSMNAKFYLAGHTHTTLERDYEGIPILNGETTSCNFDKRDFGFRLLKIDAEMNYTWEFVEVEKNA